MKCQNPLANSYLKQYNNLKIFKFSRNNYQSTTQESYKKKQSTIQEDYASLNKSTLKWRHMAN